MPFVRNTSGQSPNACRRCQATCCRTQQGSLYPPALHRLERRGLIKAHWGTSDNKRRAKYYEFPRTGPRQLEAAQKEWEKLTAAIAQVLRPI
ncbi:MAG: helix-turn-helix transcriptional regulator [Terracidiphilus sp.]